MKHFNWLVIFLLLNISLFAQTEPSAKPQIKVVVNDSIVDFKPGIRASSLRTIELRVIPNTYVVTEFKISMMRGNKKIGTRTFYANRMDLLHTLMAKPGDRLIVETKHVMRINSEKGAEEIHFDKHKEAILIK